MKSAVENLVVATRGSLMIGALALSALTLNACAPESPKKWAPPEVYSTVSETAAVARKIDVKPKVDIVFVIDTSESMEKHQENLKKNVNRFVEAFEANKDIDFHIGVVSVFDSRRYGSVVPEGKYYPLGQLRPLKDPAHPGEAIAGPQYVTRAERYNEILGETLKVGIEPRCTYKPNSRGEKMCIDANGPEFEDSFSPLREILKADKNPGFIRPDAHLAVIMITDANDDSPIAPNALYYDLVRAKGRDRSKVSTFGVLAGTNCAADPDGPPTRIADFLRLSGGKAYNLCDPKFGDNLADVGNTIREKASRMKIDLSSLPEEGTLSVKFGGQEVPNNAAKGWTYDPDTVSIIISGEAELKGPDGSKLEISYVPVDPRHIGTDRVKTVTY